MLCGNILNRFFTIVLLSAVLAVMISQDGISANESVTPDELVHKCQEALNGKNYQGALDNAQAALTLLKKEPKRAAQESLCYHLIARSFIGLSNYENAVVAARESLRLSDGLPEVKDLEPLTYFLLGKAFAGLHKYEESIVEYQKASALLSKSPGTEALQSECKIEINNTKALLGVEEKINKAIENVQTKNGEKMTAQQQREFFGALVDAKFVVEEAEEELNKGKALFKADKYVQALEQYLKALNSIKKVPGYDEMRFTGLVYMYTAQVLLMLDRYDEAYVYSGNGITVLNKRKGNEREAGACHMFSGMALARINKPREAQIEARKALEIFSLLSGTEEAQKDCRRIIKECDEALEKK